LIVTEPVLFVAFERSEKRRRSKPSSRWGCLEVR
jgi:hypothetical protein